MDHDTITYQAGLVAAVYLTVSNHCTGNSTDLRDMVNLANLNLTGNLLLDDLIKHTLHSRAYIIDGIIDDRVGVDFHAITLSQFAGISRRTNLETYDDCIRSAGKHHIILRNLTDSLADDVHLNLLGRQFDE